MKETELLAARALADGAQGCYAFADTIKSLLDHIAGLTAALAAERRAREEDRVEAQQTIGEATDQLSALTAQIEAERKNHHAWLEAHNQDWARQVLDLDDQYRSAIAALNGELRKALADRDANAERIGALARRVTELELGGAGR